MAEQQHEQDLLTKRKIHCHGTSHLWFGQLGRDTVSVSSQPSWPTFRGDLRAAGRLVTSPLVRGARWLQPCGLKSEQVAVAVNLFVVTEQLLVPLACVKSRTASGSVVQAQPRCASVHTAGRVAVSTDPLE